MTVRFPVLMLTDPELIDLESIELTCMELLACSTPSWFAKRIGASISIVVLERRQHPRVKLEPPNTEISLAVKLAIVVVPMRSNDKFPVIILCLLRTILEASEAEKIAK